MLSTKDVKTGGEGSGMPKTIQPGNTSAVIHSIKLDQPPFLQADNGYFVVLNLEGPKPSPDFEGFYINKDNPDEGRYEGQVGRVKASRWAYKDNVTKSGLDIKRDHEIMKFIKNLCDKLDCMDWWNSVDEKYATIEDFIDAFNEDKPFEGKKLEFCICGREYHNKEGYVNHDLFLPKFSKAGIPFESSDLVEAGRGRLIEFNEDNHIEKAATKNVESFEGGAELPSDNTGSKAPEFEL